MTTPTRAQVQSMWQAAVDILEESRKFGNVNTKNAIGMIQALTESLITDFPDEVEAAAQAIRAALASNVSPGVAAAILRPILKEYMRSVVGLTNLTDDQQMFDELYRDFAENARRVQSRVITFGNPTAASANVGNSQIIRLNKDSYNFDIESQFIDAKRALCILDQNSGTQIGNEAWQLDGNVVGRDDLQRSGSGAQSILRGLTADDSLMGNASFDFFAGSGPTSPTGINNWANSAGNSSSFYTFDSVNTYRIAPSMVGGTSYSLKLLASTILSQKLTVQGNELDPATPYALFVIFNSEVNGAQGTLTGRMGTVANSVSVTGLTGWRVLQVPNPVGQGNWFKNFNENDLDIEIEWSQSVSGVLIAEALLLPATRFDNSWYWIVPATASAFVASRFNDKFTWADSSPDTGKIQKWNWRAFGRYLPHANGSSITFSDP